MPLSCVSVDVPLSCASVDVHESIEYHLLPEMETRGKEGVVNAKSMMLLK